MSKTETDYERVRQKYVSLKRLVEDVIIADYQYQYGVHAKSPSRGEILLKKINKLYTTVVGTDDLTDAAFLIDPELEKLDTKIRNKKT